MSTETYDTMAPKPNTEAIPINRNAVEPMKTIARFAAGVLVATMATGCVNHSKPVAPQQELTAAEQDFEAVWLASQDVLRTYGFPLERRDRREGMITTGGVVGKHWFEFWRHDASTAADLAENTLQTIFRVATVTVRPRADAPDSHEATVVINVSRSDAQPLQISSASEAAAVYSPPQTREHYLPADGEEAEPTETEPAEPELPSPVDTFGFVSLGRDANLEAKIATEIAARARKYLTDGR